MWAMMEGEGPDRQGKGGKVVTTFTWQQRVGISLFSFLGWLLVWVVGSTLRYQIEGWKHLQESKQKNPIIYCFWHNQIFSATHLWRSRSIVVLTSRHFDGEAIAGIIRRFGYGSARGSSSRGAASALLELKRCIRQGRDVAFTADGPRGPAYKLKKGPVWLSRKTGASMLPFHIQPKSFWSLKSWDGFRIPKPFSRVLVKIGRPLTILPGQDEASGMEQVQSEMDRLRHECEAHWGSATNL